MKNIPSDKDVEMATLGACLISKSALVKAVSVLTEDYFYSEKNRVIFNCIATLARENKSVDLVTISSEFPNEIEKSGGIIYLTDLTGNCPNTASIDTYIQILEEKRLQRNAIQLGHEITELGFQGDPDISNKIREKTIDFTKTKDNDISFDDAFNELNEQAIQFKEQMASGSSLLGCTTGLKKLDELTNGIMPGSLYIVAGYTSSGKTQLTLNLANKLLEQDKRILMMSLEMSPKQVAARMTAIHCGEPIESVKVKYDRFKGESLMPEQLRKIEESQEILRKFPVSISMNSQWTALKAKLVEISILKNYDIIIIDFIQNLQSKEDEYTKLTNIAVELQNFCINTGVTVIATSQIPKDAQINKYDDVISLKGSGAIAEKADVVMLISYDKNFKKEEFDKMKYNNEPLPVVLNIAKNREGKTGGIELSFDTWTGRFMPRVDDFSDL